MTNKERISAILLNIKNWSWDIFPKFVIEKEDADALRDLEALKEYIKEKEDYERKLLADVQTSD